MLVVGAIVERDAYARISGRIEAEGVPRASIDGSALGNDIKNDLASVRHTARVPPASREIDGDADAASLADWRLRHRVQRRGQARYDEKGG